MGVWQGRLLVRPLLAAFSLCRHMIEKECSSHEDTNRGPQLVGPHLPLTIVPLYPWDWLQNTACSCRCQNLWVLRSFKMAPVTYTHRTMYFKASLGYFWCLIQCQYYVNSCYANLFREELQGNTLHMFSSSTVIVFRLFLICGWLNPRM